ncbi:MAG: hypothetical protein ABSE59_06140, partial [Opitutaceae bacterium]
EGRLETDSAFKTLHATGHLRLSAGRLELVEPRLRALGGLTVETDFDLTQNTAHTRVDRLTVQVAGARPVAEVRALQPFEFDSRTIELKVADPTKELLGFTLQGLPLAWIQPFLPGLAVAGNDVTGALLISARNGGFHFESSRPLEMRNFSVARAGHPLARLDQMAFIVTGDYTLQQGWQASLSARAQDGPRTLFTLQTKAGSIAGALPAIKATGRGQADLAALFAQPALASLGPLTGGSAQLDFQASFDEKKEVEAKFTVAGMTSLRVPSLPTLAGEVRAEQAADGQVTFNLPLTVENAGRKSDLALSGKFRPGAGGADIDVRLASNLMVVDDLKILAAPFAERSLPPTHVAGSRTLVPVPSAETRDAAPPWKGVTGRLTLALKKIVSGPFEMDDVAGELKIGSDAFALDPFRAVLGSGGEIKAASTVDFAEAAPEPYSLKAKVAASNVDSAPLFRALDPAQPPTVEGKFGLTSELASQGLTLAHLARRVQGEATLTSKSGIFRGLARSGGAQVLGPLSGPAGGLNRSSDFASVGRLTDALQQFPYDQINVQLIRDSSLNVQVKDFSVISQPLRVTGTGRLTYQKGVSLLNQSLALQIQLAARDDFATLFDALRKLSSEKDELGYTRVSRPIEIAGTPAHPDTDDLYAFLEEGGASRTLDRYLPKLLNLFGK